MSLHRIFVCICSLFIIRIASKLNNIYSIMRMRSSLLHIEMIEMLIRTIYNVFRDRSFSFLQGSGPLDNTALQLHIAADRHPHIHPQLPTSLHITQLSSSALLSFIEIAA